MADDISFGQNAVANALATTDKNFYETRARNALAAQYGPAYSDPQMASQAAQANETTLMTPLRVQAQTQQNALNDQTIQTGDINLQQAKSQQQQQALGTVYSIMDSELRAGKSPDEVAANATARASQLLQMPPDKFAPFVDAFKKDPQGWLAQQRAQMPAIAVSTMTPDQRVNASKGLIEANRNLVSTEELKQKTASAFYAANGYKSPADALGKANAWQGALARIGTPATTNEKGEPVGPTGSLLDIAEAKKLISQMPAGATMRWIEKNATVSGSAAARFMVLYDKIKHGSGLADVQNIQQSGQTMGRVTNQGMTAASDAIVNIGTASSRTDMFRELSKAERYMTEISRGAQDNLRNVQAIHSKLAAFEATQSAPNVNNNMTLRDVAAPAYSSYFNPQTGQRPAPQQAPVAAAPATPAVPARVAPVAATPLPGGQTVPVAQPDNSAQGARDAAAARTSKSTHREVNADVEALIKQYGRKP